MHLQGLTRAIYGGRGGRRAPRKEVQYSGLTAAGSSYIGKERGWSCRNPKKPEPGEGVPGRSCGLRLMKAALAETTAGRPG